MGEGCLENNIQASTKLNISVQTINRGNRASIHSRLKSVIYPDKNLHCTLVFSICWFSAAERLLEAGAGPASAGSRGRAVAGAGLTAASDQSLGSVSLIVIAVVSVSPRSPMCPQPRML